MEGISPDRRKIKIRLKLKDRTEGLVLILTNVFYLLNNLSNLGSLSLLNNTGIYHHNKDQILYNLEIHKTLAFARQYKTSFLLHLPNSSAIAVNFLKNSKVYKKKIPNMNQTKNKKLFYFYLLGSMSWSPKLHLYKKTSLLP